MKPSETLLGLLEHFSPSGQEGPAVDYLVGRMAKLGFTRAFADQVGNAVGIMGAGPRQIVLLGHIDTVPGKIPIRQTGTQLYARGSVDAKGPLAAFVEAVAQVGAVPGWQFVVIGAIDEERDSTGARYVAEHYQPDFAIIGEPSNWDRITLGYMGAARMRLTVQRSMEHSAAGGQSASEIAMDRWLQMRAWVNQANAGVQNAFERLLCSLAGMHSRDDGLTETATLDLSFRLPRNLPPNELYTSLKSMTGALDTRLEATSYPIPAYLGEKNNALVRAFLRAIRQQEGEPRFVRKTGTADLNIVAPAWGCPALAYGPGDSNLDHTPHESIDLVEYEKAVEVLASVITKVSPRKVKPRDP